MNESRAAVYHFTDGSKIRPVVVRKEIERIREFACKYGFHDADVFLDDTLCKQAQIQRQELMENISSYDALFLKDFYHLRKSAGICMSELACLAKGGVKVCTLEDGCFQFVAAPFMQNLKTAAYYCGLEIKGHSSELQFDIMNSFISNKTNWKLTGCYADLTGNKVDGNQAELGRLIKDSSRYDIILVQSFGHIHWRTSKFCKMRHLLKKGIYSMHEEIYVPYEKEGKEDE